MKLSKSPILSCNGCVSSDSPLASQIGLEILKKDGNAADAAVAMAAALNVTHPCSTGIGGDAFCLFYNAEKKHVFALNGSGKSPLALTVEKVKQVAENDLIPPTHGFAVTVPGAAAAWLDTLENFGSKNLSLDEIFNPAIELAKNGFPVTPDVAHLWGETCEKLKGYHNPCGSALLTSDHSSPKAGTIMKMPLLAETFATLVQGGKKGFYEGRIASSIVEIVNLNGGCMSLEDLKNHTSELVTPISTTYKGVKLWETPPNTQGLTAILALNFLEHFDLETYDHNSSEYLHLLIEAFKLAFSDSFWYCSDPEKTNIPLEELTSKMYAEIRKALIPLDYASRGYNRGSLHDPGSDTVYITTTDKMGNACSFINSNYQNFGTGLVPEGCGFTLQNRGHNFGLDPAHPNVVAGGKRPFHTIIPAMLTDAVNGQFKASFGVMGGFMQPQGHVQVLLNMLEFGMNPQEALDASRIYIDPQPGTLILDTILIEDGIEKKVIRKLQEMGHKPVGPVKGRDRSIFGRGHIITRGAWWAQSDTIDQTKKVFWGASDFRGDGIAIGY